MDLYETLKARKGLPVSDLMTSLWNKQGQNMFDWKYKVGYAGSYPNIIETELGESTEWIESSKFGTKFYVLFNSVEAGTYVIGWVGTNDKSIIETRAAFFNVSAFPVNEDVIRELYTTIPMRNYKYIKFYVSHRAKFNYVMISLDYPSQAHAVGLSLDDETNDFEESEEIL